MAKIISLSELPKINVTGTLMDFITSLAACKLENGTFFSGLVRFSDLRELGMGNAEIQGVIYNEMLIDLTLTSITTAPYRWSCSCSASGRNAKWVAR